jgi:hypothetical protein
MNKRLALAVASYAVLAAIASRVLTGKLLYAVLFVFGALAIRTLIAARADR